MAARTATVLVGVGIITGVIAVIWYFRRKFVLPCGPHGYGDLNDDGTVDERDVAICQWIVNGVFTDLNPELLKRADVDGDGVVTQADVSLIEQYANGAINTFPVCGG